MKNGDKVVSYYKETVPIKLTEARKLKLHTFSWGLLTDYYLESVKINNTTKGIYSSATIRVSDRAGQITCVVKGNQIGLLFGLAPNKWQEIETLCLKGQQLFYRYFKNGISRTLNCEQKIFYNFCATNQKHDVLVAKVRRAVNMRNAFKSDPLLEIIELQNCDDTLLDIYTDKLRVFCDDEH